MSVQSQIIDPSALPVAAREAFATQLYATHCRIFAGVSYEAFVHYVVDSPARRTRIQVFRDGSEIVGYAAFHVFECEHDGRACVVLRTEVGLLPAYRRGTRMGKFLVRETIGALYRHRGTPVYGLSCATNPASYRTIARHCEQVWPHWERPTPAAVSGLMTSLATQFQLAAVEGAEPGIYHVGWKTLGGEHDLHHWRSTSDPASRLYIERNPGYPEGHGMLIVVPLSASSIARTALRLLANQVQRKWKRWQRRHHAVTESARELLPNMETGPRLGTGDVVS